MSELATAGRRERTKAANRAALVAAARDAFGELGYEAVGVRDIVRRTDLASGTFYNYFPDKEAVFRAVVEATGAEARRRVHEARAGERELEGFVAAGYRAYFAFIVEDPATFAFLRRNVGTLATAGPRARAAARRRRARGGPRRARGAAAPCPRSTSTTGPTPWSRSASSWARAWPSATRRTSRARRASPPSCSSGRSGAPD